MLPPLAPRAGVEGFDDPGRDEVEVIEVFPLPLPLPLEAGIVGMTMSVMMLTKYWSSWYLLNRIGDDEKDDEQQEEEEESCRGYDDTEMNRVTRLMTCLSVATKGRGEGLCVRLDQKL